MITNTTSASRNWRIILFGLTALIMVSIGVNGQNKPVTSNKTAVQEFVFKGAGNPYLPLWEHLPDGEPRVFEDPDKPGKYRAYIIGSHDLRFGSYCGRLEYGRHQ